MRVFFFVGLMLATACNVIAPTKPAIIILSPPSGSVFREGEPVNVQSTSSDPGGIARVELLMDGVIVRVDAPPSAQTSFGVAQTWNATQGSHVIGVRAYNTRNAASDLSAVSILVAPALATVATPTTAPIPVSPSLIPTLRAASTSVAPTIAPAPTSASATLAIQSFTADTKDVGGVKQFTFNWKSTGGTRARIISGATQRFPEAWDVQPSGTFVIGLKVLIYPNPTMTLIVFDGKGNQVSRSIQVAWACPFTYFFAPVPATCPQSTPAPTPAAEESFQAGRMVWLKEMRTGDTTVVPSAIFVLYNDGRSERYPDLWNEGMPASDPALVPPAGLFQPVRGFGKVWRENATVRAKLGWATANEKGFDSVWQPQMRESLPSMGNLRMLDGSVIEIASDQAGTWKKVTP